MPTSHFKLPANTRNAIEEAWGRALTKKTIKDLKRAADFTIACVRSFGPETLLSAGELAELRTMVRSARQRHADIAKAADKLLRLIKQDEEDVPHVTLRRKTDDNVLERVIHQTTVDDAISAIRRLARLASRPYPAGTELIGAPKKTSAKSSSALRRSVWNGFILDLMVIYLEQTGKLPTVTRSEHEEEGYSSPFISGLYAIYDVLPDDVQRTVSKRTLGSRALVSLSKFRDGLTRMRA